MQLIYFDHDINYELDVILESKIIFRPDNMLYLVIFRLSNVILHLKLSFAITQEAKISNNPPICDYADKYKFSEN